MGLIILYFLVTEFEENGRTVAAVTWAIGGLGMAAQLIYTLMSRPLLLGAPYEEVDTLDNEMMFTDDDAPQIKENSGFALLCALIGGVVSTVILGLSTLAFKEIFELEFTTLERIMSLSLMVIGLTLSAPAVIYNFRTYAIRNLEV
jgi:hypothetical protein